MFQLNFRRNSHEGAESEGSHYKKTQFLQMRLLELFSERLSNLVRTSRMRQVSVPKRISFFDNKGDRFSPKSRLII